MQQIQIKRTIIYSISLLILSLILISCVTPSFLGGPEITRDPLRFTKAINAFKAADSVAMPAPNSVLFVGSSSVRGWKTLAEDIPEIDVINRGFGGSHMTDLIYYMDDIVFPYNPNAIVVYEGDNDIAAGLSPSNFFKDYMIFINRTLEKWPELPIFFISIKPSLDRIEHMEKMAEANALVKAHMEQHDNLYYIDVFNAMLGEDGKPLPDIFIKDGLHMNAKGYAIWTQEVKKELGIE